MLDDLNVIQEKDSKDALSVAAAEAEQVKFSAELEGEVKEGKVSNVIVAGMGGSALAAGLVKNWLDLNTPFEIIRDYKLPKLVNEESLVIISSYSGNTEEVLAALEDAEAKKAKITVVTSGGKLAEIAKAKNYPLVALPGGLQPRMALINNMCGLLRILEDYRLVKGKLAEVSELADWLQSEVENWLPEVPSQSNLAKQLALKSAGKTPVIYAGPLMAPVAYKWKISFNENSKNVAFYNYFSEFNHNEIMGWVSHPVEKPFVIFNLISGFENPRILKRFDISEKLLSGRWPSPITVELKGDSVIKQMLLGSILADFVSIYLAILNGVDPTQVEVLEKLKTELKK